ncbi:Adaptin N terminal region family protein [Tritrichomonas foetus]|uniref:Adaptin N terminal region family protein n=1 Tax=Tritrichomonas foetus TaxID=1144522 RepID=A0A1J4JUV6_9EUKA|nr:Adaptin N terminal region family protein [Tritrichomonas foetus]|eukprot:OHT02787.1 Adaptin N terminal region family protein [Tritrichomonas foetus]
MADFYEGEQKTDIKTDVIQLRDQLDGNDPKARKNAAKRVISLMRSGENVQPLFTSMLRCVKTSDLELKKLTYLYLVQYSTQEPEQAIMAVNTFIQDSQDSNPLIRALAVRNMCRIHLENVAENMIIPLRQCLKDQDPYVRKTAVFGVSKLYDIVPEAVENANLFDDLLSLLHDENPMVVSNTTAAIFEINEKRTTPIFNLNSDTIAPLLSAITSCTEWCQTIILDALSHYQPVSSEDAVFLIDRLIPFLKNNNPAVVIGAFRCIFQYMDISQRNPVELFPQIIPPFITLVSNAEIEVQYVVLRTLSLFVQKFPRALSKEIRVFFCKYNEPSYVKMEKLDIIVTIASPMNIQLVLNELNEYCNSVDVAFVQKSIRCIGQIAMKMENASARCVDILVELVSRKADYSIEEAIVVVCDILRKYPGKFESVLNSVCAHLDQIKEPRAKVAGIWILGEYCSLIENVDVILDPFLDSFHDEQPLVQLQILSSLVKVYLCKPDQTRDQLQFVLNQATKDGNVPDVKNRALIYWRLLSADSEQAKKVVVFGKQAVVHSGVRFSPEILAELIRNMGNVSGVLHVVPSDFVNRVKYVPEEVENDDLLDDSQLRYWRPMRLNNSSFIDVLSDSDANNLYLRIVNKSPTTIGRFALAINKNAFGISLSGQPMFPAQIDSGDVAEVTIPLACDPNMTGNFENSELQIALRTSAGDVFGLGRIPVEVALSEVGNVGQDAFRTIFAQATEQSSTTIDDAKVPDDQQLLARKIYIVGKNDNKTYITFGFSQNSIFVGELTQNRNQIVVVLKTSARQMLPIVLANASYLFSQK